MLIKSITLENFRQYKQHQTIEFSTDKEKNVTVIIGENGIGKTTFLQSFLWCLYGETDFSDKTYLNRTIKEEMFNGEERIVFVELCIIHNSTEYYIKRRIKYKKTSTQEIKEVTNSEFEISKKNNSGQLETIPISDSLRTVQEILPKDLSTYFFFDNERLGKMSVEINKRDVSETFSKAVKNLLGLTAMEKTLEHLNGENNNSSVIALYRKEYTSTTNNKLSDTQNELSERTSERENKKKELESIEKTINTLVETLKDCEKQLQDNLTSQQLLISKTDYLEQIKEKDKDIKYTQKEFLKILQHSLFNFLSFELINQAGESLKNHDVKDAGIPDIRDTTIKYLINERKACLCGACIEENNEVYNRLIELLKHVPPQSLDKSIYDFITNCQSQIINTENYIDDLLDKFNRIKDITGSIDNLNDKIKEIEQNLDVLTDIDEIRTNQKRIQSDKEEALLEKENLKRQIEDLDKRIDTLNQNIDLLSKKDSKNHKINVWRAYAEQLYNDIKNEYDEKEKDVRIQLSEYINNIFKEINGNEYSITVDEKYHIQIVDSKTGKWVETSTGQTNSAILSFISGCIQLAKRQSSNTDNNLNLTEPYPLVMDALFSTLDETHVEQICNVIPNITEQSILFTIEKDWKIAQQYLMNKVGKIYEFDRIQPYSLLIKNL